MKAMALIPVLFLAGATSASAGAFDGSTAMNCSVEAVMSCMSPSVCVRGTAETQLLPKVMVVDVPGRVLTGGGAGRTIKIVSVGHGAGRLLLHGEEALMAGTAWNVVVDETSGAMTGAVLSRVDGYLVFGTCAER